MAVQATVATASTAATSPAKALGSRATTQLQAKGAAAA